MFFILWKVIDIVKNPLCGPFVRNPPVTGGFPSYRTSDMNPCHDVNMIYMTQIFELFRNVQWIWIWNLNLLQNIIVKVLSLGNEEVQIMEWHRMDTVYNANPRIWQISVIRTRTSENVDNTHIFFMESGSYEFPIIPFPTHGPIPHVGHDY